MVKKEIYLLIKIDLIRAKRVYGKDDDFKYENLTYDIEKKIKSVPNVKNVTILQEI